MAGQVWCCEQCGEQYDSPVRITGRLCGNTAQHKGAKRVEMKEQKA